MAMGISEKTLRRWLVQHRQMLGSMGVNPNARLLPPKAVRYVCEELGIVCLILIWVVLLQFS